MMVINIKAKSITNIGVKVTFFFQNNQIYIFFIHHTTVLSLKNIPTPKRENYNEEKERKGEEGERESENDKKKKEK